MTDRPAAHRTAAVRVLAVLAVLSTLAACSDPDGPEPTAPATSNTTESPTKSPTDPAPDVTATDVRATLGALDPCGLLGAGTEGARSLYAEGPHTCEGQLGDVRVRVEVGVPFDEASREAAEPRSIAGLAAYDQADRCRVVFPAGSHHGIAVEADSRCRGATEAGAVVGAALATDIDARLRTPGPDGHTACALMNGAVADPGTLVDAVGDMTQGLDHCEVSTGAVLARTTLSIDYARTPLAQVARLLDGELVTVAGQDAVVSAGESGCYVHTYLWSTRAEGRGKVGAQAILRAATCEEARNTAADVVEAAAEEPPAPTDLAELLVPAAE
jgi:hypothetical protein